MPTILLARHAQGSFGGEDYDVLSDHGHDQVAALRADLARRGVRIDRVVSGSLARQRDTAQPIADAAGLEVEVDPRWNEYDTTGVLGHHSDSLARPDRGSGGEDAPQLTSKEFQDILDGALLAWIAAGADGPEETWDAFHGRATGALRDVAEALSSGQTALVCTSGGVIAALAVALLGVAPQALLEFNRVSVNAGLSKVIVGRGGVRLVSFNEHTHLEPDGTSLVTYR